MYLLLYLKLFYRINDEISCELKIVKLLVYVYVYRCMFILDNYKKEILEECMKFL